MGERGLGIRSGAPKQGWEESEFPILCESCLGDNPYIRMLKHPLGRECKVCMRPFTVFKWKAGTSGRFKKTEVCQTCAKLKNVCQTCLFDLQYGLPVEIRDKFLGEARVNVPVCEGNRDYWAQLATENLDTLALPYQDLQNPILEKISRSAINYERNKPHLCTFWQKGDCSRGSLCPFRHEDAPELQSSHNIKDRFYGVNDPVAKKILSTIENSKYIKPPEDKSLVTLVASFLDKDQLQDLKTLMQKYGAVQELHFVNNHAFVTFDKRASAEDAIKNCYSNLVVQGKNLFVVWAKKVDPEASAPAVLHLHDHSLAPAFDLSLNPTAAPPLPKLPPVEVQTPQQQNEHLVSLMTASKPSDYSATKPESFGGLKPNKKLNLVNY